MTSDSLDDKHIIKSLDKNNVHNVQTIVLNKLLTT